MAVYQRWCWQALLLEYSCGISNPCKSPQSEINLIFSASARKDEMFCSHVGFLGVFQKQDTLEAQLEYWDAVAQSHSPTFATRKRSGDKNCGWLSDRRIESHSNSMELRWIGSIMSRVLMMAIKLRQMEARRLLLSGHLGGLEAQFNFGSGCHSGQ